MCFTFKNGSLRATLDRHTHCSMRLLIALLALTVSVLADIATPGSYGTTQDGVYKIQYCNYGYGYVEEESGDSFCGICSIGEYSSAQDLSQCKFCRNKPPYASYISSGMQSSACLYECHAGYYGSRCASLVEILVIPACIFVMLVAVLWVLRTMEKKRKRR